jgi:hypothetical protein
MDISKVSKKPVLTVLIEAIVVGVGLIAFVYLVETYLAKYFPKIIQNIKIQNIFLSGFLFHIVFEYSGINLWYAKDYYKKYL